MKYALIKLLAALMALFSGPVFAAPCLIGACTISDESGGGVDPLTTGNGIAIEDQNVSIGLGETAPYEASGAFDVGAGVTSIAGLASISFSQLTPPADSIATGFLNLTIEFFQGGGSIGAFQLTDADGLSLSQNFSLAVAASSAIEFQILGSIIRNFGASLPDYNINLSATTVPVPGALPLLMAGLAGLGFAMKRKKRTS